MRTVNTCAPIIVLYALLGAVSGDCPTLIVPPYMDVPRTYGYVGDQSMKISCEEGYKLDTNVLSKYIICDVNATLGYDAWNDTLGECVRKTCPKKYLSASYKTSYLERVEAGTKVTVSCSMGYALHVDYKYDGAKRVRTTMTVKCVDNPGEIYDKWNLDSLESCTKIECEFPPPILHGSFDVNTTFYDDAAVYRCDSGHAIPAPDGFRNGTVRALYSVTASCNRYAKWELIEMDVDLWPKLCKEELSYIECLEGDSIIPVYNTTIPANTTDGNIVTSCIETCRLSQATVAGVHEDFCQCGHLSTSYYESAVCDTICPDYNDTTKDSPMFCGGYGDIYSVYSSVQGCFNNVSFNWTGHEMIEVGDKQHTCMEVCRYQGTVYGVYENGQCLCDDMYKDIALDPAATLASEYDCELADIQVLHLEKFRLEDETCADLFAKEVRRHGNYILDNPYRTEWCSFKDNTSCEANWVGYNGHCYYFKTPGTSRLSFDDARDLCRENNAELVSILSEDERDFINSTISGFPRIRGNWEIETELTWWLGMVDSRPSSVYTWLDGNVLSYNLFAKWQPDVDKGQCTVAKWQTTNSSMSAEASSCTGSYRVICKKPTSPGDVNCMSGTFPAAIDSISDPDMSMTQCSEWCKGKMAELAMVKNDTCQCLPSSSPLSAELASTVQHPNIECNMSCPGDSFQFCGLEPSHYSVKYVSGSVPVTSCQELQTVGISDGDFIVQDNLGEGQQVTCEPIDCPYSFVSVNGNCYKFSPSRTNGSYAFQKCAEEDAYMVVIETDVELQNIVDTISKIALYSDILSWRLGLSAVSTNNGYYRWSNGRTINSSMWDNNQKSKYTTDLQFETANSTYWNGMFSHNLSNHICERGSGYLGCWNYSGERLIEDYDFMTIQLCVEMCRSDNKSFAFLGRQSCACADSLPDEAFKCTGSCTNSCSGQSNQVCGGEFNMSSVYEIDFFPPYSTIEDMYDSGIYYQGTYELAGVSTTCNFIDQTAICDEGWISVLGNCYRHFEPSESMARYNICASHNASQASLVTVEEYNMLMGYVQRIDLEDRSRPYSGITNGGYGLDVFMNQDGKLMTAELKSSGYLPINDLYDDQKVMSFQPHDITRNSWNDGGVICKKETSVLGCYERPDPNVISLDFVLQSFDSVELTQCKQLCNATVSQTLVLMGNNFCACADEALLNTLTVSTSPACDVTCKIHIHQKCGDGSIVWAHQAAEPDVPLAESCTELYSSGLFYNAYYMLWNNVTEQPELRQCGFSDDTTCPARWLGKDGNCYKFQVPWNKINSIDHCFELDSYLFNPIDSLSTNAFVDAFITESGLMPEPTWLSGIFSVLYNVSYVTSDGCFVRTDYARYQSLPRDYTTYAHGQWSQMFGQVESDKQYICQTNSDYLGCHRISPGVALPTFTDKATISLTSCLQWCQGQMYTYAAVSNGTTCQCLNNTASLTPDPGQCWTPCEMIPTQSCGGDLNKATVVRITEKTGIAKDCRELFRFGVIQPGVYMTQWNESSPKLLLKCFDYPNPLDMFTRNETTVVSRPTSGNKNGFSSHTVLFSFPLKTAWKPMVDNNSYIQLHLVDDYLITGLLITGRFMHEERSHVTYYRLTYIDPYPEVSENYTLRGSNYVSSGCDVNVTVPLCYNFLWHPFVSRVITIYPLEWKDSVSLKVAIMGQQFSAFNHNDPYIGCCPDFDDTFELYGSGLNLSSCLSTCRDEEFPFADLTLSGDCYCGSQCASSGFVENDQCPTSPDGYRTGSAPNLRAIYRTYEKHCEAPPNNLTHGHILNITYPYQKDLTTYGTIVKYECDIGWEPVDPTISDESYCQQSNEWSNVTMECIEILCPVFTVVDGDIDTTEDLLSYNATINVTCHDKFWADNHEHSMVVTCQLDRTWTAVPACLRSNLRKSQRYHEMTANKYRNDAELMVIERDARSIFDCTSQCQVDLFCRFVNFRQNSYNSGGQCRTFWEEPASEGSLVPDMEWMYVEMVHEID